MPARDDLLEFLKSDEKIECLIFGPWGWGRAPDKDGEWESGYGEPKPPAVPFDKRGVILSWEESLPYLEGWDFYGGFGAPECYAVRVWTNQRVIWVTQYDGSTGLDSAPRNPTATMPNMPGG